MDKTRGSAPNRWCGPTASLLLHGALLLALGLSSAAVLRDRIHSSGEEGVSGVFTVGLRGRDEAIPFPPRSDDHPRTEMADDPPDLPDADADLPVDPFMDGPPAKPPSRPEVRYESLLPHRVDGPPPHLPPSGTGHGARGDGPGDGAATTIYNPPPDYPASARRRGIEGEVSVEIFITAAGAYDHAAIVEGSGCIELDDAALDAVKKWTFRPATLGGRPVAGSQRYRFVFKLENK